MAGNQEEERRSVYFYAKENGKGMQIFVVADIWNCYNVSMKKVANCNLVMEMLKWIKGIGSYLNI